MQIRNPAYKQVVAGLFDKANFIRDLGVTLVDCGPGWCETTLTLAPRHLQQTGVVHFGVQATVADHSAGAAATTLMQADQYALTTGCTLHLLRGATGERLRGMARVLKAGRTTSIVEAEVFAVRGAQQTLVSKATFTMAVMKDA